LCTIGEPSKKCTPANAEIQALKQSACGALILKTLDGPGQRFRVGVREAASASELG